MSSMRTAPPQLHAAPSPHGDLELTGLRGWVARRPLTAFLVIALGLSWLLFCVPVLAFRGVPGANLPVEAVVLFGLPVIALLLGLIFGGSLQTTDVGPALINNSARSCWLSW
jgi:hypothetical protein